MRGFYAGRMNDSSGSHDLGNGDSLGDETSRIQRPALEEMKCAGSFISGLVVDWQLSIHEFCVAHGLFVCTAPTLAKCGY